MADYNLNGLNPREFEHLIQSLAISRIAPGTTPFGDGPDGGREATYKGLMDYPSTIEPWNGYLVIQCKFLTRPSNSSKDGEWAVSQLKADLSKFLDVKRKLPKPQYYLFVTNVILSPVQDDGYKDKIFKEFKDFSEPLGLKGYDVWDHDKLCRLLDNYEGIRNKYLPFIATGDILARMLKLLEGYDSNFEHVITNYLQRELRADLYVKLEQAGQSPDHKTPLAQVFVDLPVSIKPIPDYTNSESEIDKVSQNAVEEILLAGAKVLKRSAYAEDRTTTLTSTDTQEPGRHVLIGGPGQGKSTIGQFLCQLYRYAILKDRPLSSLPPETSSDLRIFNRQCHRDNITIPISRRFPVRIVLDQFASELANNKIKSLLSYVLEKINNRADTKCSIDDLRRWLLSYPWLLVLDGLDEVPATSNRKQVLDKILDFWDEVSQLDADVLVLATTRPQGYNDDFSPKRLSEK